MKLKVDILLPDTSLYEVLHYFTRKIFEAFERAGCSCRLLEGDERYSIPLKSPPDFTLGFNGALKIEGEQLFCDYLGIPHISCLVDPPFRFMKLLKSSNIIMTTDERSYCPYFRDNFSANLFFMPHAVEKEYVLKEEDEVERIYDVVLLGTFIDCEARRLKWKDKFSPEICVEMEEATEKILDNDQTTLIQGNQSILKRYMDHQFDAFVLEEILSEVELYIKGRDKLDLVQSITDSQVHVFGGSVDDKCWKEACKGMPNVIVHPAVSFSEALEIMKQSKIILNSCIKNKQGAHERLFSGMAAGAVVVTNDNAYMREHFVDKKEVLLFKRSDFKTNLNQQIKELISDKSWCDEISNQGRNKVLSEHTWDHRVVQLLSDIENNDS